MGVVEAAHRGDGDWKTWCSGLFEASQRLFVSPAVNAVVNLREAQTYTLLAAASPLPNGEQVAAFQQLPAKELDPFWRYPHHVATLTEIREGPRHPTLQRFHETTASADSVGMVALAGRYGASIGAPHAGRIQIAPRDRRLLRQIALHLEAGLRLRAEPQLAVAWIHPDGRVLHVDRALDAEAWEPGEIRHHVQSVERSRTRLRRSHEDSVEAWTALIGGRWALAEHTQASSGRVYAVIESERTRPIRALTRLEMHAVELSARGMAGKEVAYALGLSDARVSTLLSRAALKLGVAGRTQLVRLAANLLGVGPQRAVTTRLSPAERDVLALLRLGFTNEAIARERKRSERTVANQVASLLQKLNVPSRRALATVSISSKT